MLNAFYNITYMLTKLFLQELQSFTSPNGLRQPGEGRRKCLHHTQTMPAQAKFVCINLPTGETRY